jgi:hypothetical protein
MEKVTLSNFMDTVKKAGENQEAAKKLEDWGMYPKVEPDNPKANNASEDKPMKRNDYNAM